MDTRDFSQATIEEIYDIIEKLKDQGSLWDSIQDYWCISDPSAGELSTYAAKGEIETYYQQHADKMNLTKKKFEKIVENVRAVDYKYQKEFTKCNEELKTFQETLKNLTEEISLGTVSLDSESYKHAAEILEGNDEVKKQKLKELIGVKPGESRESRMNQKIQEILKYSIGGGSFEDEIDPESKEASISQKKKLIQEVESIKEQFRNGKLTQEEVIDKICGLYRIEDYGSKINYSLAVKKYQPEKKARIVSDILSTVRYIVEEEALNAEQLEKLSGKVKAKSYISDEMWSMAESAFRGAVAGANTAIAGKYYAGLEESKIENVGEEGKHGSKTALLDELAKSGVKYNPDEVVMVIKNTDGKLMWLEKGNSKVGLTHILERHADDFATQGVSDIPNLLESVLSTNPIKTGSNTKGLYADYAFNGNSYRVAYGTNGFVVSFYPID